MLQTEVVLLLSSDLSSAVVARQLRVERCHEGVSVRRVRIVHSKDPMSGEHRARSHPNEEQWWVSLVNGEEALNASTSDERGETPIGEQMEPHQSMSE
jgi:glutamate synthase domain-containing protein 1